jgi:pimeloyl-ACP methyl ester carboxylesterase
MTDSRTIPEVPGVTHRFVQTRGTRFHVAQAGDGGEPVVLLHGLPLHWYSWRKVIGELAGDYRLYCIDLRGCGWTEGTKRGYSTTDQASDVLAVMDALGLDRVRLIGHETGAWLGFELCLAAPERFTGLLALNSAHPWQSTGSLLRGAWRFWYTAFWEYPGPGRTVLRHWPRFTRVLLRHWAGRQYEWDPAVLAEFVEASRTRDASRAIEQSLWQYVLRDIPRLVAGGPRRRLTVPTLVIGGKLDPVSRPAVTGRVNELCTEIVPGGHLLPETAPRLVAAAVRKQFAGYGANR